MINPCRHQAWEPVELALTGEHVANLCADCLCELPLDYDGEVQSIQTWAGQIIAYIPCAGWRYRSVP